MPGALRVAVSGLGRIGRLVIRALFERPELELVAINAAYPPDVLAQVLTRDSTHGTWTRPVRPAQDALRIDHREVRLLQERDPERLPWRDLGVDLVVDSTGVFRSRNGAGKHLTAGARRVIVTAPPSEEGIPQVVLGVNEGSVALDSETILSTSSCTTNCLAPLLHVLHTRFGVERGFMTTVHALTSDQRMLDGPHKDPRRARAGLLNIVPTTSGAAEAIGVILPELAGRVDGLALRVPTADVSMVDLTAQLRREIRAEEINAAFKAAAEGSLAGIVACSDESLVSSDLIGDPHSAVVDGQLTASLPGGLVKVMAWYDNEGAYARRVVDLAARLAGLAGGGPADG